MTFFTCQGFRSVFCLPLLVGCQPEPVIIEEALENALAVGIPSVFEVVNYKEGGLNDYSRLYEIRLSESEIEELLIKINSEEWEKIGDSVFRKTLIISKREQVQLGIDSSVQLIHGEFNFEQRPGDGFARNAFTAYAAFSLGRGESFDIDLTGTARIY